MGIKDPEERERVKRKGRPWLQTNFYLNKIKKKNQFFVFLSNSADKVS